MPLGLFHPVVGEWFAHKFGAPTDAQRAGWPAIARGEDTLIAAPTGSGKTLAAFLWCLDRLLVRALAAPDNVLPDATEVLYVSPLKALSTDVEKNLAGPLAEIERAFSDKLLGNPRLRVAVRTGDTPVAERARAARRPPHILITTPESLYILLTSQKGRAALATVKTVIVDEIHALMGSKRGSHLALSLERLDDVVRGAGGARPTRIGLSATQKPLEEVGRFLVGTDRVEQSTNVPLCNIVDVTRSREFDLAVEIPRGHELSAVASYEMWDAIYDRIAELAQSHRTTLVFCNTRRLVERAAHALGQRLGEDQVRAHHGSLARATRLDAEQRLKSNDVKLVVATASLELGIDIGAVELVVQLGSPRSLSVLVQRIGRSGHWLGGTPKGRLFATTRDELIECAAIVRAVRAGELDTLCVRREPLDILAQQLVAECAAEERGLDELYALARRAWPYRALSREDFERVLDMLSTGIAARRGRTSAHLHLDAVNRRVKGRRGARLAAITSGGAIPDTADFAVVAEPDGTRVGTLSEDFAVESMRGDIFLLGNTSWEIRRIEAGTVRVVDAQGAPPTIPFWVGEAPGRSPEASVAVSALRHEIDKRLDNHALAAEWLAGECSVDPDGARQAVQYLAAGKAMLGAIPTQETLIAERFFDEGGGMQLVLHAPFGSRINRAWGLALRKRFCRSFNFELQAAATDDGIVISLGPHHSFPLDTVWHFVPPASAREILTQALLGSPMFPTRWRWTATRALALLRFSHGKKTPPQIQRMRSDDLLAAVFPDQAACPENLECGDIELPNHPLVVETIRDCLDEPLDCDGVERVLGRIARGEVSLVARDVPAPSVFSEAILNSAPYTFLDDAPLEERRTRAVMTRRTSHGADSKSEDLGALDDAAIDRVRADAWPTVRDADELHDALLGMVLLPTSERVDSWRDHFAELVATRRATVIALGERRWWCAAERLELARAALGPVEMQPPIATPRALLGANVQKDEMHKAPKEHTCAEAHLHIVRGWMDVTGPITVADLAARLGLPALEVEIAMGGLESQGLVLRGRFTPRLAPELLEWCHRRLLARIHQMTLGRLRREIAPVEPADLMRFLLRWQRVMPGTQLHGAVGLREIVGQLQGYEVAAAAWEREVLPRRVATYEAGWLDELCWRGELAWGRLSPPSSSSERVSAPTRATPVGIFLRAEIGAFLASTSGAATPELPLLGHAASAVLDELTKRGASFFADLVRTTRRLPAEVTDALGELVAAGRVTGDSFAALRSLFGQDKERGHSPSRRRRGPLRSRPGDELRRQSVGRWSLLRTDAPLPVEEARELKTRQLLRRYGVLFRDLIQREPDIRWTEVLPVLRRMEGRGELRGGHFVSSFVGEQFALPEAVEALREIRRQTPSAGQPELCAVAGTDPLNLVGIITPGPRVPSVSGNLVLYRNGVPIASREAGEVVRRVTLDEDEARRVTRLFDPATRALAS